MRPLRSIWSTGSRSEGTAHEMAVMCTARVGTSGARGATGMLVRTPRELPARSTARTLMAPGGGAGKSTENVPSGATSTGASSTVTVDASFTRPVRATGAPRTAGRVGPVISMRGRTRSTVNVQSRWARPGPKGWSMENARRCVPSERSLGR